MKDLLSENLKKESKKLILFGGKGGVGKTTCALSTALYLASDYKTLVFSTDPAHSLSDSLGQKIGSEITSVNGIKNLNAIEIDAKKALTLFMEKYRKQITKILDSSTYFDSEDIESVMNLSIPGMDEVMGFKTIIDFIEEDKFEKYIVDTAPTGHALRLLTMPELMNDWIKVMAKMRWKYRYMVESFKGEYVFDDSDDFLLIMKKNVKKMEEILKDPARCEFIAVTIPEYMGLSETERLLSTLNIYGITVRQLIINNFMEIDDCDFCRERKKSQEKYVNLIKEKYGNLKITVVPLQSKEVKGIDALHDFGKLLFNV